MRTSCLGDGVLGIFGAPERLPDHADRALAAAADMLAAVESHFGERCRIGIGINSGLVLVGTIGGGGVSEFGVIGDPVNVAARIQDATRELRRAAAADGGDALPARGPGHRPGGARIAAPQGQGRAGDDLRPPVS